MKVPGCMCGGQGKVFSSQPSPFTAWVLETKVRSPGSAASVFTHRAILSALVKCVSSISSFIK